MVTYIINLMQGLYAVQRGVCLGCGFHQPHHLRFEADHIVALSDDGKDEVRNLQPFHLPSSYLANLGRNMAVLGADF